MNADEVYAYIKGLENINATLTRENRNLKENGSGNVATIMKLTEELEDCRASLRHAVSNEATAAAAHLTKELEDCQRSLRHAVEKELSRHTFTIEDIKGWLLWRAADIAKDPNMYASAVERQWLADILNSKDSGIVNWKAKPK